MSDVSWKDVLLGILSGWVVLGILSSILTKKAMAPCSASIMDSLRSQQGVIALVGAIAVGALVWWFAKKSHREDFAIDSRQLRVQNAHKKGTEAVQAAVDALHREEISVGEVPILA
jgi:fructose-specific phosphotransferase system IIC component